MPEFEHAGLRYATDANVYDPSDDTWLLIESLDVRKGDRFLEVGCGAGLVAIAAARFGARVTAADRNLHALKLARDNARRNQVSIRLARADLLRGLRPDKFETIAFNPPYLPTHAHERLPGEINRAFDGGPTGRDVALDFLAQLAPTPPERCLLLASTLQDTILLEKEFERLGFQFSVKRQIALSHETLLVYDLFASQK
jgi:release factor glutamine methyltransferase